MLKTITLVGIGGAIGSIMRYLASTGIQNKFLSAFPFGTMFVNISGCFLIGIIYALAQRSNISPEWRFFFATGICGGYTTFSSFSYESLSLLRDGEIWYATAYISLSVILGILATFLPVIVIEKL
jgi:fluoride exporter